MSDRKNPKLVIPESESMRSLQFVEVELLYDDPYEYVGEKYTTNYYTLRNLADNIIYSLGASAGLHSRIQGLGVGKGAVISIARVGSGTNTNWDVGYISGPRDKAARPAAASADHQERNRQHVSTQPDNPLVWEPLTQEDLNVMMVMADNHLDIYGMFYALVATKEIFKDLSDDQQARVATGAMISVSRQYRRGMVIAGEKEKTARETFEAETERSMGTDDIVDAVIDGIVKHTQLLERRDVINLLRDFSMSSETIKSASAAEIMTLYDLCARYGTMVMIDNWDSEDAKVKVADELGLTYDGLPF
jgi:hypothetical protein